MKTFLTVIITLTSLMSSAVSQPTGSMLARALMVQSGNERGTIFMLDLDGREYWITAKHILTHAQHPPFGTVEEKEASLRILNPGIAGENWLDVKFGVIDPGKDVDIVVLVPQESLMKQQMTNIPASSAGAVLGGDCEFLGYPFGGAWQGTFAGGGTSWMPFVKHCTIAALGSAPDKLWILDGINNVGFSGGPVFYGTGDRLKILGVVSGFRTEPADVIPKEPSVKPNATANVNSGFFLAYDIAYAVDAIKKNPIGPLRAARFCTMMG